MGDGTRGGDRSGVSVVVDRTHMGRRASGIERITRELFSPEALAPLPVTGTGSPESRRSMVLHQMLRNPLAAVSAPRAIWIFPGYPPSPVFSLLRDRTVLYVHDLFLLTRKQDLNVTARVYMAPSFRIAVGTLRYFLVNSEATGRELAKYVPRDARILPYRPRVTDVFGLASKAGRTGGDRPEALRVGALGTIEPRKNFGAAARICAALSEIAGRPVELHVIGRRGWGPDFNLLSGLPHVRLHGFMTEEDAGRLISGFDMFLCTSHDEGLGLPLLEMQYAGLPVIAPDGPVFREVLGSSGVYIDPRSPEAAARRISGLLDDPEWRRRSVGLAQANLERWNGQADQDRHDVIAFLTDLTGRLERRA